MIRNEIGRRSERSNISFKEKALRADRIIPVVKAALNNALSYNLLLIAVNITIQKIKKPGIEKNNESNPATKTKLKIESILCSGTPR
jgi:hypothetical protein